MRKYSNLISALLEPRVYSVTARANFILDLRRSDSTLIDGKYVSIIVRALSRGFHRRNLIPHDLTSASLLK